MAIDLIPDDYRKQRDLLALLRHFGIFLVAVIVTLVVARALLWGGFTHQQKKYDELMAGEKAREQKYQQVESLEKKRNALLAALNKREDMIATPSIPDILGGLDKSFSSDVWLTDLGFTLGLGERKGALPGGTAPVATSAAGKKTGGRLDLRGAARNYAAVYQFVENFSIQPGVVQVQVVETLRDIKSDGSSVSFVVEAQLANAAGNKP